MLFYIIRHGQTLWNAQSRCQGASDVPLNDIGRETAVEAGKGMPPIRFDRCISSPLCRARETAEIILKETGNEGLPIEIDDRLREICMGDWEGKCIRPGESEIEESLIKKFFTEPRLLPRFPNGEDVTEVMERTQEFLREMAAADDGKTYLLSSHGLAIRAMLNFLYEDPGNFWQGRVPYNCSFNIVEAKGGKLALLEKDRIYYEKDKIVDYYKKR